MSQVMTTKAIALDAARDEVGRLAEFLGESPHLEILEMSTRLKHSSDGNRTGRVDFHLSYYDEKEKEDECEVNTVTLYGTETVMFKADFNEQQDSIISTLSSLNNDITVIQARLRALEEDLDEATSVPDNFDPKR